MTQHSSTHLPAASLSTLQEQRSVLSELRSAILQQYRPHLQEGAGPIRVMARIVAELEQACRDLGLSEEVIRAGIVNRTIGDINLRLVTECEGEPGSSSDYRLLADELGVALPGEQIAGITASGQTYRWLREQMTVNERLLLAQHYDPRIYDIYGVGNPLLRSWLARDMACWGFAVQTEQVYLGLGAMDCIDKVLRGLAHLYRIRYHDCGTILFPEPGFHVPEWQARSCGYRICTYPTLPEHGFKLTATELEQIVQTTPDLRIIYLVITNNPTTLAYTPTELNALHSVLRTHRAQGREILILADLAYIGTGKPAEDHARMATFAMPDVFASTIFVSSFSKTHTFTGERFGWVTCGDPHLGPEIAVSWTNTTASLPGEWQLRFMACYQLLQERPWLSEKLRAFYRLRRARLIEQLHQLDRTLHVFEQIYLDDDATVYNWSKLRAGEDAFSLFEKTGIAGVPGSGFGYADQYIRLSVGVIPISHV